VTLHNILKGRGGLAAEFVLVVVGVLVALAVDTAFENRRDSELRDEYIERVRADVEHDRQALEYRVQFFNDVQVFSQQFLDWLDADTLLDNEIVLAAFYSSEIWPFVASQSTYQDLLSTGSIRLIDDINLRTSLATYHNQANTARSGWEPTEDYRRIIRGVIPNRIQDSIREDCPTLENLDGTPTGFPPCELAGVDYDELQALFAPLKTDRELRRRLVYRQSELSVVIFLLDNQRVLAEDVLSYVPGP
jgi:hypothetical protein